MNMKSIVLAGALASAALLAGCGGSGSPIGLVDVQRLTANWPQYTDAQNQLVSDERAIQTGKGSTQQKQQQVAQMQKKYTQISNTLVQQVRDAAAKVAQQKNMQLVVTREFVGYGGTDITPDVEKLMGITEKASPSPSP